MSKTDIRSTKSAPNGASTPVSLLAQNERSAQNRDNTTPSSGPSVSADGSNAPLTLIGHEAFDDENEKGNGNTAIENADDASLREFYSQLVTLLTQENNPQASKKKEQGGIMISLKRRWLPALLIMLLAFGGLVSVLRPRQITYEAGTTLLLPPRETGNNADPFAPPEDSYDTQAQLAIIGSEEIIGKAIVKVPAELRYRGWGSRTLSSAPVQVISAGSDSLIYISTSSRDAVASLRLVEEMVRAYTNYTRSRYNQNRNENVRVAEKRVADANRELESARNQVRTYKETTGIFDATSQQGNSASSIGELETALASAQRQSAIGTNEDGTLNALRQRAFEAQVRYQDVVRDFFPDAPQARTAQRELDRANNRVQDRINQLNNLGRLRVAQLQASLAAARKRASALPGAEQTLSRLNERVQTRLSAYRIANDRFNQLNLVRSTVAPVAKTLHSPGVGSNKSVQWIRALAVSLVGALGLGIVGGLLFDRLDRSVRTVSDTETVFGAPVLGAMPAVRARRMLAAGANSKNVPAKIRTATIEACYTTQNHLQSAATAIGASSILITSSLPKEGKSQCAASLAAAMAYGGRQVLLIDVDFWHPSQHEVFELELEPGYSQVLHQTIPLSQAIRTTTVPNLYVLTAGQAVSDIGTELSSLLSSQAHQHNLQTLKRYFDTIIIDGPPTMTMADAQLLSSIADSVVLVTTDSTHRDHVQRARSMLRLSGGQLLGVVINSARMNDISRWNLNFTPEEPFSEYSSSLRKNGH